MKSETKQFDCVEMKRKIQERIYEETRGMTPEELTAYFHRRAKEVPFSDLWKKTAMQPPQVPR